MLSPSTLCKLPTIKMNGGCPNMTKKDYCLTHEAIAVHDYYYFQIHGIEHGIDDYVYLSRIYQPRPITDEKRVSFHKLKIYTDKEGNAFIRLRDRCFDGTIRVLTLDLDNTFMFVSTGWVTRLLSCEELASIADS